VAENDKTSAPPPGNQTQPAHAGLSGGTEAEKKSAAFPEAAERSDAGSTPAPAAPTKPAAQVPAAPAAKHTASDAPSPAPAKPPAKPTGPMPEPWSSPMVEKYKRRYGSGLEALKYLNQDYFCVDRALIPDFLRLLSDEDQFDYCVDITAVHYPKREKQFDVIWVLYSFPRNERVRVKTQIADGASVPSSVLIWPTANWLEREVFDMFGIRFDGHPDLKRILLPDGWKGHPLRKDYGILQQDQQWVQINLGIESGQ
jgi:NADH-quinone oxidoreductase subunit C